MKLVIVRSCSGLVVAGQTLHGRMPLAIAILSAAMLLPAHRRKQRIRQQYISKSSCCLSIQQVMCLCYNICELLVRWLPGSFVSRCAASSVPWFFYREGMP
jgi:hypothetical protein